MAEIFQELDLNQPLVDSEGKATAYFESFIYRAFPLIGLGVPNSNVVGDPTQFYIQTDGAPQQKLWQKVTGNNTSTGWELV
jgi:hypothetical protein